MAETTHTSGPWTIGLHRANYSKDGKVPRGSIICAAGDLKRGERHVALVLDRAIAIVGPHPGITNPVAKANARLIAAAPDMLAALKAAVDVGYMKNDETREQCRAAIATATGA